MVELLLLTGYAKKEKTEFTESGKAHKGKRLRKLFFQDYYRHRLD